MVNAKELVKFGLMSADWWDSNGSFFPLHALNRTRLAYFKEIVCRHFGRDEKDPSALIGLKVLDVGCGGGLVAEPMARMGATVTGIDACAGAIEIASLHAKDSGLVINYYESTVEDWAISSSTKYDVVLALEVIEHAANVDLFVKACTGQVGSGGIFLLSTINKTWKSFTFAIIGAEYLLKWLPIGTHSWSDFVTPQELVTYLRKYGFKIGDLTGMSYNLWRSQWVLSQRLDINYIVAAVREGV